MKDDILVIADLPSRDASAQALLDAIGREHVVLERSTEGRVELAFASERELERFRDAARDFGLDPSAAFVRWSRTYSPAEIRSAPLLRLIVRRPEMGLGGPSYGTRFDLSVACRVCGTGAVQTSPLIVAASEIAQTGDIAQTLDGEILVSLSLADALGRERLSGIELRPVVAHRTGREVPWRQLVAKATMPPLAAETVGVVRERPCPTCGRDGFFGTVTRPEELVYSLRDMAGTADLDVVATWERFGNSVLRDPIESSHFASPLILAKPRVYDILAAAGTKGVGFTPVRVR
jgi:hypothetical protein